ncbi:type II toxin-antitoxin system RelE/ParE family toxin [Thomasclavelia cocleata]|uniref:type II toxin-antitoxin system RelE/ParE family toxin n=1 Tax=Thomasclavelia cocleata TaxID=69824 RepID=UPI0032E91B3C
MDNKLEIIKNFPQSYRVIFRQHDYDYRKMIVRNYIFVYYIDEIKNELVIFRIFHELEDYQNKLSDSKSEV